MQSAALPRAAGAAFGSSEMISCKVARIDSYVSPLLTLNISDLVQPGCFLVNRRSGQSQKMFVLLYRQCGLLHVPEIQHRQFLPVVD